MAIAFDKGTLSGDTWLGGDASKTQSHTHNPVGTPSTAFIVAHVWGGALGFSNLSVVGATYGGVAMTLDGHVGVSDLFNTSEATSNGYLIFFSLPVNVLSGARTAAVTLTRTTTAPSINLHVMSITYTGVVNMTFRGTDCSLSNPDTSSTTFTSASGDVMLAVLSNGSETGGELPTDTIRYSGGDFGSGGGGADFSYGFVVDKVAAGSTTSFGFSTNSTPWGLGAYDLSVNSPGTGMFLMF